jgi:hypothetical protein
MRFLLQPKPLHNQPRSDAMPARSTLAGFAFASSLFAAALLGLAVAAVTFPELSTNLFGQLSSPINGMLFLQASSGLLAALGTAIGAVSFRSSWGKVATVGGLLVLVINAAYFCWAFSLVQG